MGRSSWDCATFGPSGQPASTTEFTDDATGISIEIYKNWLYVRDPKSWNQNSQYSEPIVMEIRSGVLDYGNFTITAARHPVQDSIFCLVKLRVKDGDDSLSRFHYEYFGGLGCYAYLSGSQAYLRFAPEKLKNRLEASGGEWFWNLLQSGEAPEHFDAWTYGDEVTGCGDEGLHSIVVPGYSPEGLKIVSTDQRSAEFYLFTDIPNQYVGLEEPTYRAWLQWVKDLCETDEFEYRSEVLQSWVKAVESSKVLRFNQGDAYLAQHLDVPDDELATPVGQAKEPLINRMLSDSTGSEFHETPEQQSPPS